jgi:hypothetical protein
VTDGLVVKESAGVYRLPDRYSIRE